MPKFLTQTDGVISCEMIDISNCEIVFSNECHLCKNDFYLKNISTCLKADPLKKGCIGYSKPGMCSRCIDGYLLDPLKGSCVLASNYAEHLPDFCEIAEIENEGECEECKIGFFLLGNLCVSCHSISENCLVCDPVFPTECIICMSGYFQNVFGNCVSFNKTEQLANSEKTETWKKAHLNFLNLLVLFLVKLLPCNLWI